MESWRLKFRKRVREKKYYFLLVGLVLILFIYPVAESMGMPRGNVGFLFVALIIGAVIASSTTRRQAITGIVLGTPTALLALGFSFDPSFATVDIAFHVTTILLLSYTAYRIGKTIATADVIAWDMVLGAVCMYALLAVIWAVIYQLIASLDSSHFPLTPALQGNGGLAPWLYLSIVTLTTLGYGDIVPASNAARALTCLEALVGQLFLALTVARLVGMYLAHRTDPRAESPDS